MSLLPILYYLLEREKDRNLPFTGSCDAWNSWDCARPGPRAGNSVQVFHSHLSRHPSGSPPRHPYTTPVVYFIFQRTPAWTLPAGEVDSHAFQHESLSSVSPPPLSVNLSQGCCVFSGKTDLPGRWVPPKRWNRWTFSFCWRVFSA